MRSRRKIVGILIWECVGMLSGSIALAPWLGLCALVDLAFLQFRRNLGNR